MCKEYGKHSLWPYSCMEHRGKKKKKKSIHASESESCSVMATSLTTPWTVAPQVFCPWDSPGKNIGSVAIPFSRGIFPNQVWNPDLLHCRQILYCLSHQGSPKHARITSKSLTMETRHRNALEIFKSFAKRKPLLHESDSTHQLHRMSTEAELREEDMAAPGTLICP